MPEEVFVESKSADWTKVILAAVVGLGLLAGSAYAGYYYGTQQVQQSEESVPTISQPTPKPTPTPEPTTPPVTDSTADWKMYVNAHDGYRIKYPSTWTLYEPEGSLHFASPDLRYEMSRMVKGILISIDAYQTNEPQTYETLEEFGQSGSGWEREVAQKAVVSKQRTSLGNLLALWTESKKPQLGLGGFSLMAIDDDGTLYTFTCSYELAREEEARELFELMIGSFHILK